MQECAQRDLALLETGLAKFPDSFPLNFEAALFNIGIGRGAAAERALLHLRELLRTKDELCVERPLLFAYLYQGKRAELATQVDHCLGLCPGDEFFLQIKESLPKGGPRQVRVPVGSPNEVSNKGAPSVHLALDRAYKVGVGQCRDVAGAVDCFANGKATFGNVTAHVPSGANDPP